MASNKQQKLNTIPDYISVCFLKEIKFFPTFHVDLILDGILVASLQS